MTTSELWAKAEAEGRYPYLADRSEAVGNAVRAEKREGAVWGILHVLSLLESEPFVDAVQMRVYDDHRTGDTPVIRDALAAGVAAITNQETGASERSES